MPEINVDEVTRIAKDAAYIAIGFGVLTLQKAQVQRRELNDQFQGQVIDQAKAQITDVRENLERVAADATAQFEKVAADATTQFEKLTGNVDDRVKLVEERLSDLEERIEQLLDEVESKLPEQAAELVAQAREVAREARGQVRSLVSRAA